MKKSEKNVDLVVIRRNGLHEGLLAMLDDSGEVIATSSSEYGWQDRKKIKVMARPVIGDINIDFREEKGSKAREGIFVGKVDYVGGIQFEKYELLKDLIISWQEKNTLEFLARELKHFEPNRDLITLCYLNAIHNDMGNRITAATKTSQIPKAELESNDRALKLLIGACLKNKGWLSAIISVISSTASYANHEFNKKQGGKCYTDLIELKRRLQSMLADNEELERISIKEIFYGVEE